MLFSANRSPIAHDAASKMQTHRPPIRRTIVRLAASFALAASFCLPLSACSTASEETVSAPQGQAAVSIEEIPAYNGTLSIEINGGVPGFTEQEASPETADKPFESYSPLDSLGRCKTAFALIGPETLPTKERGDISEIHPSGWKQARYDTVDQKALYNRSHLIAYQLAGEDANERNLITGTRTMNSEGMLPYEELVGDWVRKTDNHVLYRITPVFEGNELVARGVQMEALSVEDGGEAICFNVFVYNVEPEIEIDYATGESRPSDKTVEVSSNELLNEGRENGGGFQSNWRPDDASKAASSADSDNDTEGNYVINTNNGKFHDQSCESVDDISPYNKQEYSGKRSNLINEGYEPCGRCNP